MDRVALGVLVEHSVHVGTDSPFQGHARLAQAVWREWHGYPIGRNRDVALGSRLEMPWAEDTLAGYLTADIRRLVRAEVLDADRNRDKFFGRPRIFNDLLSSQPLCFNAFGELAADLNLASRVGRRLWPDLVDAVERIEFEWSPGRASALFLNNRSAFDVAWFCRNHEGEHTFIGIEVKYHENLRVSAARHQVLYDELAASSEAFASEALDALRRPPLQQLWLDHLLVLSMLRHDVDLRAAQFVLCAPDANRASTAVAAEYAATLQDPVTTFTTLSLDRLIDVLNDEDLPVARELRQRYLPWTIFDYQPGARPADTRRPSERKQ